MGGWIFGIVISFLPYNDPMGWCAATAAQLAANIAANTDIDFMVRC